MLKKQGGLDLSTVSALYDKRDHLTQLECVAEPQKLNIVLVAFKFKNEI